jgi:hypothetical protein
MLTDYQDIILRIRLNISNTGGLPRAFVSVMGTDLTSGACSDAICKSVFSRVKAVASRMI